MPGFFDGLMGFAQPRIDELRRQEDNLRQEKQAQYVKIIDSPDTSPETKQWAQDEISKLYGGYPEAKKHVGKVIDMHGQIQQAKKGQDALPLPQQNTDDPGAAGQDLSQFGPKARAAMQNMDPQKRSLLVRFIKGIGGYGKRLGEEMGAGSQRRLDQARQGTMGGAEALPLPNGATPPFVPPSMGRAMAEANPSDTVAKQRALDAAMKSIDDGVQKGWITEKEAPELRREAYLSTMLGLKGSAVIASAKPEKTTDVVLKMKDGSLRGALRTADGKFLDYDHQEIPSADIKGLAPKPSTARPTLIAGDFRTLDQAKQLKASGMKFYDAESDPDDPKELDLEKIPSGMVLQGVELPGGVRRYTPRSISDKIVTVNCVQYAVNPAEVQQLPTGAGTTLGPKSAGTERISPITTTDANQNTIQTPGITRPLTPGIPGRPDRKPAASNTPPAASGTPAPGSRALPTPQGQAPLGSRTVPGVPTGQYQQTLQRITPVREAATQIFGDPARPDLKPLMSYAALADSKDSQQRLGKALRLSFNGFEQAMGGPSADARVGPFGVSTGGLGTWISNHFNMPAALADQQTRMMQDAIRALSPQEREAFDSIMSSYSTIVGLRSLTRASAAQSSVAAIEREMPAIGLNTFGKDQFIDQMRRLAEVVKNGTKGVNAAMLGPELTSQIESIPGKLDALSGKGKGTPVKNADDFRKKYPDLFPK